jgi:hypothetical protein
MKHELAILALSTIVLGFVTEARSDMKCTGNLTVNSIHKDAKGVAAGFLEAEITFDSASYNCTGGSFSKTAAPTTRNAILGLAPGVSKELLKEGAKLKIQYENYPVSPEETMGMGPDWDEKWTVLGVG